VDRRLVALFAAIPVVAAGALVLNTVTASVAAKTPPANFIEGTVTSGKAKAEAGVWVIAEAKLGTGYRKIVVTDAKGRFVLPELPKAGYKVWVRGYGLLDSKKVGARPGATLALHVKTASRVKAAQIYPANYWLSLFNPPAPPAPAPGATPPEDPAGKWNSDFKLGCMLCHQIGSKVTRSLPSREAYDAGTKKATVMYGTSLGLGREALLDSLADWSARIRGGETPKAPPRPKGAERNMVITQWNWGNKFTYAHDEVSTDKNNPRLNANGPVYGVDLGNDFLLKTDPVKNTSTKIKIPTAGGFNTPWCDQTFLPLGSTGAPVPNGFGTLGCPATAVGGVSAYVGAYTNPANPHNPMMDAKGRVWFTTQIRREFAQDMPSFCKSDPIMTTVPHHRQLGYYDPKTKKIQLIDTCFGTHHLQFDKNGRLWVSGDSFVLGWFDPSKFDPARPETLATAQGWSEMIIDTNGDGIADKKVPAFNYGIVPNQVDGSVWTGRLGGGERGDIMRFDPATNKFEVYSPPAPGYGPRGVDVDSKGIIWTGLGGSGHLASFDRSKCHQTFGTGNQCPEGWTLYKSPGPLMRNSGPAAANLKNADFHYYLWVDRFNTLGMGKDTVILNGTDSDSLLAFNQKTKKFTVIRIPYPMNIFTRGLDGRIDNPTTGWKGRGLWFDNGLDPIIHSEKQQGFIAHVQYRPNPLAR
jgi:streptogramin lyase